MSNNYYSTQETAGIQAVYETGAFVETFSFAIPAVGFGVGDTVTLLKIPAYCALIDFAIDCPQLDSAGSPTVTIDLGDGGNSQRYIAAGALGRSATDTVLTPSGIAGSAAPSLRGGRQPGAQDPCGPDHAHRQRDYHRPCAVLGRSEPVGAERKGSDERGKAEQAASAQGRHRTGHGPRERGVGYPIRAGAVRAWRGDRVGGQSLRRRSDGRAARAGSKVGSRHPNPPPWRSMGEGNKFGRKQRGSGRWRIRHLPTCRREWPMNCSVPIWPIRLPTRLPRPAIITAATPFSRTTHRLPKARAQG